MRMHSQAPRRFLTDFSHLKDAPPPAIAIWEHYIPYGVTLGVAQEVLRRIGDDGGFSGGDSGGGGGGGGSGGSAG
ncbi:MAG: DUF2207 family protein [Armatimonadota bacterium]